LLDGYAAAAAFQREGMERFRAAYALESVLPALLNRSQPKTIAPLNEAQVFSAVSAAAIAQQAILYPYINQDLQRVYDKIKTTSLVYLFAILKNFLRNRFVRQKRG
jgi:hypothetical protein